LIEKVQEEYKGIAYRHYIDLKTEVDDPLDVHPEESSKAILMTRSLVVAHLAKKAQESNEVIRRLDDIIGICVYLILSLNSTVLLKDAMGKEEVKSCFGDIIGTLSRRLKSSKNKEQDYEILMAQYIFNENKKRTNKLFTGITYSAFISVIFKTEFHTDNWKEKKEAIIHQIVKQRNNIVVIKKRHLLLYLLKNISAFDNEAQREVIDDLNKILTNRYLAKEFNDKLGQVLFSFMEYLDYDIIIDHLGEVLHVINFSSRAIEGMQWITMSIKGNHIRRLRVLEKCLDHCIINIKKYKDSNGLLFVAYMIEDCVMESPQILRDSLLVHVMGKLIWVLYKLKVMYASYPVVSLVDSYATNRINLHEKHFRGGGFIRIILKILLLLIKFDTKFNTPSLILLQFYIFHTSTSKEKIKEIINLDSNKIKENTKYFNLFEIETKKQYEAKNIFEDRVFLSSYLIASLGQLAHFEYFNITQYKELEPNAKGENKLSPKAEGLMEMLIDICKHNAKNLLDDLWKLDAINKQFIMDIIPEEGIALTSIQNTLSDYYEDKKTQCIVFNPKPFSFLKSVDVKRNVLSDLSNKLRSHLAVILTTIEDHEVGIVNKVFSLQLGDFITEGILAYMLLLTSQHLCSIEKIIYDEKEHKINAAKMGMQKDAVKELTERVCERFSILTIKKWKQDNEELRNDQERFSSIWCHKFYKELSEDGSWVNKKSHKERKQLFDYITSKYKKLKHPLYNEYNEVEEFNKLKNSPDPLGRIQKMKIMNIEDSLNNELEKTHYNYIRYSYLKKILILNICCKKKMMYELGYVKSDFKFNLVKSLFRIKPLVLKHDNDTIPSAQDCSTFATSNVNLTEIWPEQSSNELPNIQKELKKLREKVKNKEHWFEIEIISVNKVTFGTLIINPLFMSFRSKERKIKYAGDNDKVINKKWYLKNIRKVISKCYNTIEQAIELYFDNYKSVFIRFFKEGYKKRFIRILKLFIYKDKSLKIEIVDELNRNALLKSYAEKWQKCKINNFEYIMLLNKYGGRSFNNIFQYPIFPLVNSIYTQSSLDKLISYDHEDFVIIKNKKAILDNNTYSINTHGISAKDTLSYLRNVEPFTSVCVGFEHALNVNGNDIGCKNLIPEFFYLPEIFSNHNKYFFSEDFADKSLKKSKLVNSKNTSNKIDAHQLVRKNMEYLESEEVSSKLHEWIDIVFGEKQQVQQNQSLFKDIRDDNNLERKNGREELSEIQNMNPIKLFKDKHVKRDMKLYKIKLKDDIFLNLSKGIEGKLISYVIHNFRVPVIDIKVYNEKLLFTLSNRELYVEDIRDMPPDNIIPITLIKVQIKNSPINPLISPWDLQCAECVLEDEKALITCGYPDNSCKIIPLAGKTCIHHLHFHKSMVTVISLMKRDNVLFTAAYDGTLAKWDLTNKLIEWYNFDHNAAITSLDYNKKLDLVVTGSKDGSIALRIIATGKLLRKIKVSKEITYKYRINKIRLTSQGYILSIWRARINRENDYLIVHSINGERICEGKACGKIYCVVMNTLGYQFIAGGTSFILYDLLTLQYINLKDHLEKKFDEEIIAMKVISEEMSQKLIIGLNSGSVLCLQKMTKINFNKIFLD